jgi:hypothetical protein
MRDAGRRDVRSFIVGVAMWSPLLLPTLVLGIAACGDECRDGESICSGSYPVYCVKDVDSFVGEPWDFSEEGTNCALGSRDRCIDTRQGDQRVAVCSSSGEPDSRCVGAGAAAFCFDATTKLTCNDGYSQERDCAGACVVASNGAFCSTEVAPNSACLADGPRCDGDSVIICHAGYVVDRIACASACITSAEDVPFCTDGTACGTADTATCDGSGELHGCIAGQSVAMTCNADSECEDIARPPIEAQCTPYGY